MFKKNHIWCSIISLGLLFGAVQIAVAQMSKTESEQSSQFRRIEQPLALKVAVTLGGLGLIGTELWWFLFRKTKKLRESERSH